MRQRFVLASGAVAVGLMLVVCVSGVRASDCSDGAGRGFVNSAGMEMVLIPAGSFRMGTLNPTRRKLVE
ncbi:MAG: hypothetical protein ACYTBJ_11890 [Planctomycetota bacterium]|jgi:formylglycine-generating enzyme required for sulfatase activity